MFRNYLYIISVFVFYLSNITVSMGKTIKNNKKDETRISVVVIDPGHGGKDPGATVGKAKEKDIALDIALKLGNYIKTSFPEVKIIYTRSKDIFIPLHQRANIANKNDADLFISIHVNAVDRTEVRGTETFVLGQHRSKDNLEVAKKENAVILLEDNYNTTYEGFDPNLSESYIMFELVQDEYLDQSVMFASDIQNQFRERAKRVDRSVKMADFLVLRRTTMPSVLIETGFLSNSNERNYMLSESGKKELSSSIYRAFKEYKRKIENKSSFILITENKPADNKDKKVIASKKQSNNSEKSNKIYYSVQIVALRRDIQTSPSNFKGEKDIHKQQSEKIYRYFSGKFNNFEIALKEKNRLQAKFNGAFVVAFENEKLISVKKARGKM